MSFLKNSRNMEDNFKMKLATISQIAKLNRKRVQGKV